MTSETNNIANAFSDLDLSEDSRSRETKQPQARTQNDPIPSLLDSPNSTRESGKCAFLNLPVELRLQIYDLLLVYRRFDRMDEVGHTNPKPIVLKLARWQRSRSQTMQPAILQTCRQIHVPAHSADWTGEFQVDKGVEDVCVVPGRTAAVVNDSPFPC